MGSSSDVGAAAAFRDGVRRVNGAPVLLAGVCLVTLLLAAPLALALDGMLEAHLGRSLVAQQVAAGGGYQWWQEFRAQAQGLGLTFTPTTAGFGGVLDNIEALLDNVEMATTLAGVTAAWLLIWSFLSGGIIDRLARNRPTRSQGFFSAAGVHFWRFLRLGVIAFASYLFLFNWLHEWIFLDLYPGLTRDITVERTALLIRVACYLLFGAVLMFVNVVIDYARIRIVVEDRRSALGALTAAARFVRRHFGRVASLYGLNGIAFLVLLALHALISPGAMGSGSMMWLTLLFGQAYIVARHYLKLVFYASEASLFQSLLAHADYAASPRVEWPDSPAAESIANADPVVAP